VVEQLTQIPKFQGSNPDAAGPEVTKYIKIKRIKYFEANLVSSKLHHFRQDLIRRLQ
jgi:hypothetical protein